MTGFLRINKEWASYLVNPEKSCSSCLKNSYHAVALTVSKLVARLHRED